MRVVYVNADRGIPVFGQKGAAVHVREMMRAFEAIGCSTCLLATRLGKGPRGGFSGPVEVVQPPPGAKSDATNREDKERNCLATANALTERLVKLYTAWPFDMIYERYSLWSAAGVRAGARLGVPTIVEVNAPLIDEQASFRDLVLADSARAIEAEVFYGAGALAVVSSRVATYAVARGAAEDRIRIIGNGVDLTRFNPTVEPAKLDVPPDAFVVGFTGSLKHWHGVDLLLDAFTELRATVPQAHLLIVGDGPKRGWIEDHLSAAGLTQSATLTGWMDHAALPSVIARMDAAVAPYPLTEDFYFSPLKLYEYLAVGRPVVASKIGQISEVLSDGVNGLLVPPGDSKALAKALITLAQDPVLGQRLAQGAAREGKSHSWQRNALEVIGLAKQLQLAA